MIWATATDCSNSGAFWSPDARGSVELGDRLLVTLAYGAVRATSIGHRWAEQRPWREEPLCQLLFASDFKQPTKNTTLDFSCWLSRPGVAVLEAWQEWLAREWIGMERAKSSATPEQLKAIAKSQATVLAAFLEAIDRAQRRDLARFLMIALQKLLAANQTPQSWLDSSKLTSLRLANRQQAYRDALALVEQFAHLKAWQTDALARGYFDEGYQAAQLWKSDWEAYNGDSLAATANRLLDQAKWL